MKTMQKVPTYKRLELKINKAFEDYQHLFGFAECCNIKEENVNKGYQDKSLAVLQASDHLQVRSRVAIFCHYIGNKGVLN